jgi:hypothetical protein
VIVSLPHFLNADAGVQDAIGGLKADPSKHTTYINVEPYTGKQRSPFPPHRIQRIDAKVSVLP